MSGELIVRECPFEECDWTYEVEDPGFHDVQTADYKSERHYEREHAGRVRITLQFELEQLHGDRDMKEVRERYIEDPPLAGPWELAHVRTEVVEEPDDHDKVDHPEKP